MKYTYFFYSHETGLTKIGRTANPKQRFNTLGGKTRLTVICVLNGDSEKDQHEKHAQYRENGEWFRLPGNVLRAYRMVNTTQSLPSKIENKAHLKPRPSMNAIKVTIDLAEVLTAKELESFKERSEEAGSKNLTEHFKKCFLGEKTAEKQPLQPA